MQTHWSSPVTLSPGWDSCSTGNLSGKGRLFDNISILSTIKVLQKDPKKFGKIGMTFWFIALLSTLILTLRDLVRNHATIGYYKK